MRYRKGFIAISDERDVPILLHVRNARAVTFDQLCSLVSLEGVETLRRSVQWRVTRLEQAGLLERILAGQFFAQPVFRITPLGLGLLESRGYTLVSLPSTAARVLHETQVFHALELVNIRLALAKNELLRSWKTELEVASRNLVFSGGVAKDYDALVEIRRDDATRIFALEYERTVKASARYAEIRETLNRDRTADTILYLASSHDVLHVLAVEMRGVAKRIGLALSDDFRRDLLDTNTLLVSADHDVVAFRDLIFTSKTPTFHPATTHMQTV